MRLGYSACGDVSLGAAAAKEVLAGRSATTQAATFERLAADSAYGSASSLNWLVREGIAPHIPAFDKSQRSDGTFSRDDFRFDDAADVYICPTGKTLTTTGALVNDGATLTLCKIEFCSSVSSSYVLLQF